ncbi:unnamed protein product [Linum trigynum]|uniref:Uncharacterized protein n=1 Tax=Linum trigynum TaxID=586398 RepID=A0AAV2FEN1_9ROSI
MLSSRTVVAVASSSSFLSLSPQPASTSTSAAAATYPFLNRRLGFSKCPTNRDHIIIPKPHQQRSRVMEGFTARAAAASAPQLEDADALIYTPMHELFFFVFVVINSFIP